MEHSAPTSRVPIWRRLIGFNLLAAVLLGIGGWYLGWYLAHQITGASIDYFGDTDQNDVAVFLGYILGVIGFLVGLGFLQYPLARMRGYPPRCARRRPRGSGATSGSAPTTRSSASSTCSGSGSSSSSRA